MRSPSWRERYFRALLAWRWPVLAVAGLALVALAVVARNVRVDYSVEHFFPAWDPGRATYEAFKRSFPGEDARVSLFWRDAGGLSPGGVRDMERAARLFERSGLRDVRWVGNVELADGPLLRIDGLSDSSLAAALERHADDRLLQGYLWNRAQDVFAVHGHLDQALNTEAHRVELDRALTAGLAELELAGENRTLVLSGVPILRARVLGALQRDQAVFLGGGLLLAALVLLFYLRHPGQAALCLLSVVPAYLCVLAALAVAGRPLTILTTAIPIIILVVGLSDSIHLVLHYRDRRTATGDNTEAVVGAFTELAIPCWYTSATTAVGFLSLVGTGTAIVVDFGLLTAFAVVVTYGFTMSLLPVFLSFSRATRFDHRGLEAAWLRRTVDTAVALVGRPRGGASVVAAFAAVGFAGLALGLGLRVNAFMIDNLGKDHPIMRDLRWVEAAGFGVFQVNLYLKADGRPLHSPETLRWMERFQRYAEGDSIVSGSVGLPDFLRALGRDGAFPGSLLASSLVIGGAERRRPGMFDDVYRRGAREAQVVVLVRDAGSRATVPLLHRLERYVAENPPPGATAALTGTVQLAQTVFANTLRGLGSSVAIAVGVILLMMAWLFRSVTLGLLSLLPNLFPLLVLLGALKLGGFDLKPASILVFSIVYGFAVDSTIHVVGRVLQALRAGRPPITALEEGLRGTGRAVLVSAVVMAAGFAVLMASRFEVLFLVGSMFVLSVATTVAADLYFFPTVLRMVWRKNP